MFLGEWAVTWRPSRGLAGQELGEFLLQKGRGDALQGANQVRWEGMRARRDGVQSLGKRVLLFPLLLVLSAKGRKVIR